MARAPCRWPDYRMDALDLDYDAAMMKLGARLPVTSRWTSWRALYRSGLRTDAGIQEGASNSLLEQLVKAGYSERQKLFFLWEGVTRTLIIHGAFMPGGASRGSSASIQIKRTSREGPISLGELGRGWCPSRLNSPVHRTFNAPSRCRIRLRQSAISPALSSRPPWSAESRRRGPGCIGRSRG